MVSSTGLDFIGASHRWLVVAFRRINGPRAALHSLSSFLDGCGLWGLGWEGWSDTVIKNIVITALLLAGGVLYVVVWWKERQSKRAASQHQPAEPTIPF